MLPPFGLQEDLVPVLVGEAHDLVLDRRAIARPAALDLAGVHRRAVQVRADQVVHRRVGVGDVAIELRLRDALGGEAERPRIGVAGLRLAACVKSIVRPLSRQGVPVLKRASSKPQRVQAVAERLGRPSPARPPRVLASPVCMSALRNVPVVRIDGAGAGRACRRGPGRRRRGAVPAVAPSARLRGESFDHLLAQRQVRLALRRSCFIANW